MLDAIAKKEASSRIGLFWSPIDPFRRGNENLPLRTFLSLLKWQECHAVAGNFVGFNRLFLGYYWFSSHLGSS
jgi:hypothetical protein